MEEKNGSGQSAGKHQVLASIQVAQKIFQNSCVLAMSFSMTLRYNKNVIENGNLILRSIELCWIKPSELKLK